MFAIRIKIFDQQKLLLLDLQSFKEKTLLQTQVITSLFAFLSCLGTFFSLSYTCVLWQLHIMKLQYLTAAVLFVDQAL